MNPKSVYLIILCFFTSVACSIVPGSRPTAIPNFIQRSPTIIIVSLNLQMPIQTPSSSSSSASSSFTSSLSPPFQTRPSSSSTLLSYNFPLSASHPLLSYQLSQNASLSSITTTFKSQSINSRWQLVNIFVWVSARDDIHFNSIQDGFIGLNGQRRFGVANQFPGHGVGYATWANSVKVNAHGNGKEEMEIDFNVTIAQLSQNSAIFAITVGNCQVWYIKLDYVIYLTEKQGEEKWKGLKVYAGYAEGKLYGRTVNVRGDPGIWDNQYWFVGVSGIKVKNQGQIQFGFGKGNMGMEIRSNSRVDLISVFYLTVSCRQQPAGISLSSSNSVTKPKYPLAISHLPPKLSLTPQKIISIITAQIPLSSQPPSQCPQKQSFNTTSNTCQCDALGTYKYASACISCPQNCLRCNNFIDCTQCQNGFTFNSLFMRCQPKCNLNQIRTPTQCICNSKSIRSPSGQCTPCPPSTTPSPTSQFCLPCPQFCQTCTPFFCITCLPSISLNLATLTCCPPSQIYNSITLRCQCRQGDRNGQGKCVQCRSDEVYSWVKEECVKRGVCGNLVREGEEQCDDGNQDGGDGCSEACRVESGFGCGDNRCVKILTKISEYHTDYGVSLAYKYLIPTIANNTNKISSSVVSPKSHTIRIVKPPNDPTLLVLVISPSPLSPSLPVSSSSPQQIIIQFSINSLIGPIKYRQKCEGKGNVMQSVKQQDDKLQ